MNEREQIITVKEARRLLGDDCHKLTDEEVTKLITDLDFLARHALRQFREEQMNSITPDKSAK